MATDGLLGIPPSGIPSGEQAGAAPIGPGRLVLVVGASGAGKDSLIRAVRAALRGDGRYAFPQRTVTRPPGPDEDNIALDEGAFARLVSEGAFALHWAAHGHLYGIPVAVDRMIADGATVVCNVSRTVIGAARCRYRQVQVVEITAPPEVLAARIAVRGRTSDGDAARRVERSSAFRDTSVDLRIDNGGDFSVATEALLRVLRQPA